MKGGKGRVTNLSVLPTSRIRPYFYENLVLITSNSIRLRKRIALQEAWQVLQQTGSMRAVRITLRKLRENSSLCTVDFEV